jgi:hypothetical protein
MIQGRPRSTAGVDEVRQRTEVGSPDGDVVSASTLTIKWVERFLIKSECLGCPYIGRA